MEPIFKIFLSILNDELIKKMIENNLIPDSQNGFVPERGANFAVSTLIEIINDSKQKNEEINLLQLDFKMAYDLQSIQLLMELMKKMNFNDDFIQILKNCLFNNKTKFETNFGFTKEIDIKRSFRQGNPISPSLYILMQSPLIFKLNSVNSYEIENLRINTIAFADDLILISKSKEKMKELIKILEEYNDATGSILSPTKSTFITNRNSDIKIKYKEDEISILNENESFKFLGFYLNLKLENNKMQEDLKKKVIEKLKIIKNKFFYNINSLITLVNQTITTVLN